MNSCPIGFFCFDKDTLLLLVVGTILVISYYIYNNSIKLDQTRQQVSSLKQTFVNPSQDYEKMPQTDNLGVSRPLYQVDKDYQRVINPQLAPERAYPFRPFREEVPINIPTRGYASGYQQIGYVLSSKGKEADKLRMPLFGQQVYPGSQNWNYFTGTDEFHSLANGLGNSSGIEFPTVKLGISHKRRDCMDEYGCDEIYDGDYVHVDSFEQDFIAHIYRFDAPRYVPYII